MINKPNKVKEARKKPAPVHAPYSNIPVTNEELNKRKRKYQRLEQLGVDPTLLVEINEESENPYIVKAMVLINQDKDVPKELLDKIQKYNSQRNAMKKDAKVSD